MQRLIKHLGLVDYEPTWRAMQAFTDTRTAETPDELWVVEHHPVYTQGLAGKPEHLLRLTDIPVVKTDRGGQVTYHGPGQLVVYLLIDFKRMHIGVRELVRRIEQSVIDMLAGQGITANGDVNAPGVYVDGAKIASLGLRIKNGAVYHGLSLNVDMDLTPFGWINPCGYEGLRVTQMKDLGVDKTLAQVAELLLPQLEKHLTVVKETA
ncbi:lipoate--protein ligase [Aquitalea magnusonii]|uniref:Octanoyltransferase n=1 Tax=Aquitalea magnusonii TaxID=332411 RepID=A0A0F3KTT5_9NEIS|nr:MULTISPECIES: lipoyl(octanoyl) transferase LipB [Aquitalea]KJV34382.1 lipoate--protein ligase [Aquitalea magnusonii]NWK79701.1 lipoyl(octanoyl) transferase LipB [Aquitalea sp. LB_tupeE]QBJ79728.1 lipoyl(octanoyl) transferase LipB [Aquitalea sp. USM4]BBF85351.1 octanoate-[acyl-carrier-protein]-protein-N-octanoyltransferase [Aquitalea magnusonii]